MRLPNLKYMVDVSCDRDYPGCSGCEGRYDEDGGYVAGNDYCRCGQITPTGIEGVHFESMAHEIAKINGKDSVFGYCVERSLRLMGLDNYEAWEIGVEDDYYGQIIGNVSLESAKEQEVLSSLLELEACRTPSDMIRLALKREYGYVLPKLESVVFQLRKVPLKNVIVPNPANYLKTATIGSYEFYGTHRTTGTEFPLVVLDAEMQLVDGYHRLKAVSGRDPKPRKIAALVAEGAMK